MNEFVKMFSNIFHNHDVDDIVEKNEDIDEYVDIPEATIIENPKVCINNENREFDKIIVYDGIKYRISSKTSSEVFRMNLIRHQYSYDFIPVNGHAVNYVKTDSIHNEFLRIFITKSGKYFAQMIYSDGSSSFYVRTLEEIQKYVEQCETDVDKTVIHGFDIHYVTRPGKLKKEKYMTFNNFHNDDNVKIESHEIIDKHYMMTSSKNFKRKLKNADRFSSRYGRA